MAVIESCCGCSWPVEARRLTINKLRNYVLFAIFWMLLLYFLIYLTAPIVNVPIEQNEQLQQNLRVLSRRLSLAFRELERLKKQNQGLKLLLKLGLGKSNQTIQNLMKKGGKTEITQKNNTVSLPTFEYEQSRRSAESTAHELWSFLRARSKTILSHLDEEKSQEASKVQAVKEVKSLVMNAAGFIQFLLKNIQHLSRVDGFKTWRHTESKNLGKTVQKRLALIQNPPTCNAARTLICELNSSDCGFPCQLLRASHCLAEAYRLKRTLVIDDASWNENFQPLSKTCSDLSNGEPETEEVTWPGSESDLRVRLALDGKLEVASSVPFDLSKRLNSLRGDPLLWWRSQLFSYLMRPLPSLERVYQVVGAQIHFQKPIVGVCVDDEKNLQDVMTAVEDYFQQLAMTTLSPKRRIYVSSADGAMPQKIEKIFPHFEVVSAASSEAVKEARMNSSDAEIDENYSQLLDIHFLAKSDFIVSSKLPKLCHVAFALIQRKEDGPNRIMTIGEVGADHRSFLDHLAIVRHSAQADGEIDLLLGDIVTEVEKLSDGFSKGKNKRNGKVGVFPTYKATCLTRYHQFSKYPDNLSQVEDAARLENVQVPEEIYEYED